MKEDIKSRLGKIILCSFVLLCHSKLSAQFTYAAAKIGYHNMILDNGTNDYEGTRLNELTFNLDVLHRPVRYFGLGVSLRFPIATSFSYTMDAKGSNSQAAIGGGIFTEQEIPFADGKVFYLVESNYSFTTFGRLFFDVERNVYVDLRYSVQSYTEEFTFKLNQTASNSKISHKEDIILTGFGFAVGYQPTFDNHFYVNYSFAMDFIGREEKGFSYLLPTSPSSTNKGIILESQIDDIQIALEFGFGIGYYF